MVYEGLKILETNNVCLQMRIPSRGTVQFVCIYDLFYQSGCQTPESMQTRGTFVNFLNSSTLKVPNFNIL